MKRLYVVLLILIPLVVSGNVEVSELYPDKEERRASAFTEWSDPVETSKRWVEYNDDGKMPILSQFKGDMERAIWIKAPKGLGYYCYGGMNEADFILKTEKFMDEDFYLLTATVSGTSKDGHVYWGVWVDKKSFSGLKSKIKWFGISRATAEPR